MAEATRHPVFIPKKYFHLKSDEIPTTVKEVLQFIHHSIQNDYYKYRYFCSVNNLLLADRIISKRLHKEVYLTLLNAKPTIIRNKEFYNSPFYRKDENPDFGWWMLYESEKEGTYDKCINEKLKFLEKVIEDIN